MKRLAITTIAATAAVTALLLAGCSAGTSSSSNSPSKTAATLTLASGTSPASYDPSQAQEGIVMPFYQAVYDTLLLRKPNGAIAPMLAKSYKYDSSKTHLTLQLRNDVTFSDGSKFDATVVKSNLDNFKKAAGPQSADLAYVSSVDVVNPTTVTLNLSAPDPSMLVYLSNAPGLMASGKQVGSAALKTTPDGSGPYTYDASSSSPGSQYVYTARKGYWDPALQKYSKITIKVISDPNAAYNALASGQVDGSILQANQVKQAKGAGLTPVIGESSWHGLFILDRAGSIVPALANVKVRQAMNYAIDSKSVLKNVYFGAGTLTGQVFGPSASAYLPSVNQKYSYNIAKAKQLMKESGYSNVTIPFPVATGAFSSSEIAALTQQLGQIGVTLDPVQINVNDYIADVASGKYPLFLFQLFQPNTWENVNQLLTPDALFNPFHTSTAETQDLIKKIQLSDAADSKKAAQQLNEYISDNAWFVPMFRVDDIYFTRPGTTVVRQTEQVTPSIYNFSPSSSSK